MLTTTDFNQRGAHTLPGHLGIVIVRVAADEVRAEMPVTTAVMAPNGYLHAGSLVTLADTCAGYGCVVNLPPGAGFTTIELKSNHLGTARDGSVLCTARPAHLGKTTQVWDAVVTHKDSGRTLALFRCTQMVLTARPGSSTAAAVAGAALYATAPAETRVEASGDATSVPAVNASSKTE